MVLCKCVKIFHRVERDRPTAQGETLQYLISKLGRSKVSSENAIKISLVLFTTNLLWRFSVSVHRRLTRLGQKVGDKRQGENGEEETTPPTRRRSTEG